MKIAFLIRALCRGGAETQLVLLSTALRRAGHEVSVTTYYDRGELEPELSANGVRVNCIGKRGRWDLLPFLKQAKLILQQERADVVHSYMSDSNIVTALFRGALKPARVVWGVRTSVSSVAEYGWVSAAAMHTEAQLARRMDLCICNSRAARQEVVRRGFPARRVVVIPNGVDVKRFAPSREMRQKVRARWGIPECAPLIGRVGRLDPIKDYPAFLKAASIASREIPSLRFVCVGGGAPDYAARLKRIGEDLGLREKVTWAGEVAETHLVYPALDLLASTSRPGEGFPNVLLEAMSCGVPCVATDSGDTRDVVAGRGTIVPAEDPRAMAAAWVAALGRQHDGGKIRQEIAEAYSVETLFRRTETEFLKLSGRVEAAGHRGEGTQTVFAEG